MVIPVSTSQRARITGVAWRDHGVDDASRAVARPPVHQTAAVARHHAAPSLGSTPALRRIQTPLLRSRHSCNQIVRVLNLYLIKLYS